jgi:uncharacterized LabA/DUF88 family protein
MSDRGFSAEPPDDADRVILLIDGESLFQAAAHLAFEIDYAKLLMALPQGRRLVRAYFYTGVSSGNFRQQSFLKWMQRNGYRVVTKELVTQKDGRRTAEFAVEMATDILQLAPQVDCFILISHNANLTYAIQNAAGLGVQFELVGQLSQIRGDLLNACDQVIEIAQLKDAIRKISDPSSS